MLEYIITFLLIIIAIIHLLPISGFFSSERLSTLYGIEIASTELEILMRHRAILFGLLGAFLAYAAFISSLQPLAFIAAFVSIASFFYLAFKVREYNGAIRRVVIADVVAAVCLLAAIILFFINRA